MTEVQASAVWTPPTGTLGGIVAEAVERAEALRRRERELRAMAAETSGRRHFAEALRSTSVGVIAEVKRRSPSKGWIKAEISAPEQALSYESGGAAAISVLTEPAHFGGSIDDLIAVLDAVRIPVLKKDFHIDPIQLVEAKAYGASAALLIVRALSPDTLPRMMDAARELDIEILVETRDEAELERALDAGATIIGINNRNLETLVIDTATCERMLKSFPADVVGVAESGVSARTDIERMAACGADAVLVGSAISAAEDPTAAVRGLAGVARRSRAHAR